MPAGLHHAAPGSRSGAQEEPGGVGAASPRPRCADSRGKVEVGAQRRGVVVSLCH